MSQDLLAEFGDLGISQTPSVHQSNDWALPSRAQDRPTLLNFSSEVQANPAESTPLDSSSQLDDFDDFGDFEDPDPPSHDHDSGAALHQVQHKDRRASPRMPLDRDPNILFDAEDSDEAWVEAAEQNGNGDGDDDEAFGDFEDVEPAQLPPPVRAVPSANQEYRAQAFADLLGLEVEEPVTQRSSQSMLATMSPTRTPTRTPRPQPQREPSSAPSDDAWDDFESTPLSQPKPPKKAPAPSPPTLSIPPPLHPAPDSLKTHMPPTNIPPPALLLTLFPPLLLHTSRTFTTPLTTLPAAQKSALLTSPAAAAYLRSHHALLTVLAHVLAGRRLRWKRDRHLAQRMAIGPSAGRGMKLASVDRTEAGREDAEALDVLRAWKTESGRVRALAAAFNAAAAAAGILPLPAVPELAATMPVRVAKAAEGGIASLHACALCGLKREERVQKVDGGVEDSFGEWWLEGAGMHVACCAFWEGYRDRLRER